MWLFEGKDFAFVINQSDIFPGLISENNIPDQEIKITIETEIPFYLYLFYEQLFLPSHVLCAKLCIGLHST